MTRWVLGAALALLGCSDAPRPRLSRAELLDPETCKDCHPRHYTEWSASMHAYALEDPVFRAMNARGQEDPEAGLDEFCVSCHAPMAVREGAFGNGDFADLDQVPRHLQGVTCYFCHNAIDVEHDQNAELVLANDQSMRGSLRDPVEPWAHGVEYSEFHDRFVADPSKSARMCGACHDIVTPAGVHLERTYQEYLVSAAGQPGNGFQSCIDCHMPATPDKEVIAEYADVPARDRHSHLFPAVDVTLTPFPQRDALLEAVAREELPTSLADVNVQAGIPPASSVTVSIETLAGHAQPSGAAQDRRMWLELRAFDADGTLLRESGIVEDGQVEEIPGGQPGHDLALCMMRDRLYDTESPTDPARREVHMFWEARSYRSDVVPPPTATPGEHVRTCTFDLPAGTRATRIELRILMRPMGLDVLQDLVDSGHLEPEVMDQMPTFTVFEGIATADADPRNTVFFVTDLTQVGDGDSLCMLHGEEYCK